MAIEDTFIPVYYRISIDPSGLQTSGTSAGFIDNITAEDHSPQSTTTANSLDKERANIRYEEIIRQLSTNTNPINYTPRQINAPGRDGDNPPTTFDFTVVFSRPEYMETEDENNPGQTLTGTDAVKRFVARAMTTVKENNREVFNPDSTQNGVLTNPSRIQTVETGAIAASITSAEGNITVSEISNT